MGVTVPELCFGTAGSCCCPAGFTTNCCVCVDLGMMPGDIQTLQELLGTIITTSGFRDWFPWNFPKCGGGPGFDSWCERSFWGQITPSDEKGLPAPLGLLIRWPLGSVTRVVRALEGEDCCVCVDLGIVVHKDTQ